MTEAYFLPFSIYDGSRNMEIDEQLLNYSAENKLQQPIFRLYGWSPACVSLGRNQKTDNINIDFCKSNNIDIVRRVTGGRALLHDNEVTYSFVCPATFLKNGESVICSYKEISSALCIGLSQMGIKIEFPQEKNLKVSPQYCMSLSTGADLSVDNKKLIGSAQCRKQGYILQHGSVLLDYNKELIEKIFSEKPNDKHITTIKEINSNITKEQVIDALKFGIKNHFNLELIENEYFFSRFKQYRGVKP